MSPAPRSLIQIHYHNRLGGVRQVMRQYSDAFRSCFNAGAPDYLFCRKSETYRGRSRLIDLPDADYHSFRSVNAYRTMVKKCRRQLMQAFTSVPLDYPVAVIAHNLNLGKNPALSDAFTWCAEKLGVNPDSFRFFLIMHDYAEQGRLPLLRLLKVLTESGVDVFSRLYASQAPVHYVTLNEACRKRTGLSGKYCSLLPNVVTGKNDEEESADFATLREYLRHHAKKEGRGFDSERKLFCYPSRMIYRKNIMEALLLATIVWDGALVIGQSGTTASDRETMKTASDFAKRYNLSLVTDLSGISRAVGHHKGENPFRQLYRIADFTLSTAYTEGFGYGLHEPWLYDCPVICRYPAGMSFMPGVTMNASYRRVPVPVSWVRMDNVYDWFTATYRQNIGKQYPSREIFLKNFVIDGTVDFGRIGTPQQIRVIKYIMNKGSARNEIVALLLQEQAGWPGSHHLLHIDSSSIGKNRATLEAWGNHGFRCEFVNIFSRVPRIAQPEKWYEPAGEYFQHYNHFQPLAPR